MSAEYSFKPEPAAMASAVFAELGKLASPMVRTGVLLASIANNVMSNPRNAAIVAVLILLAMPICWYWRRRRRIP
jgi:energy-converting hydrogenase Eha subunit B